jgi:hypothetical protein
MLGFLSLSFKWFSIKEIEREQEMKKMCEMVATSKSREGMWYSLYHSLKSAVVTFLTPQPAVSLHSSKPPPFAPAPPLQI